MTFKDLPIRRKLMVVNLLTSGAVVLLTWAAFLAYEFVTLHKNMIQSYTTHAEIIAANSTAALAFQNQADATEVLASLRTDRRMMAACLFDDKGRLFARYPADAPATDFPVGPGTSGFREGHLDVFCPVSEEGRMLGTIYLESNLSSLTDRYHAYAWLSVGVITASLLLAYMLSRLLQRQISVPVLALAETARAISKSRDFSVRAQRSGSDELGILADNFNLMLDEIQSNQEAIRRETGGRLKAQGDLDERTRLLNLVLNSMSEGLVVADKSGKMTYFNAAAERIVGLGISTQEYSGWTQEYGVFREDMTTPFPEDQLPLILAVRGKSADSVIQFLRNKTWPQGIFVNVNARPLKDEDGNLAGGLVVIRDVTEERKAAEKMHNYTRRLEESNRDLQDFVFVASHDLQEPLRKIQSFGNFLKDEISGGLSKDGADYLFRMQDAARRMGILIEDLLKLTRVTTRAKPFEILDMAQILEEVVSDLEMRIRDTEGKVVVSDMPRLEADAAQMRQLFQNLIGNALKFHKKDAAPVVEVTGKLLPAEDRCLITVKDNGIGFDPKYAEKIFNIFQRLNGSEYEGTGIGLAVCRKVVERHNGSVKAMSYSGQGAVFEITLPLHQNKGGGG